MDELHEVSDANNAYLIGVIETWLSSKIADQEPSLPSMFPFLIGGKIGICNKTALYIGCISPSTQKS